jgi:hypothetical protein
MNPERPARTARLTRRQMLHAMSIGGADAVVDGRRTQK